MRARASGNVINETLMIFIVSKPIIIRDAFYSSINRRKTLLLVPTLCAAVGECPTWRLWGLTVITKAVRRFRAMRVGCSIWSRAALLLPYIPQTLDTEWNQGCQPSQLQGGEGLWLCHQVLPGTCSGHVVLRVSW